MLATQTKELLQQIRSGTFDVANATTLEQLSSRQFLSDLRNLYPVLFQERRVGRKQEIGLARSLKFELSGRELSDSLFRPVILVRVLRKCLLVSTYDDSIGEITMAASIRVRPGGGASRGVILKMGRGYKLDRTPDGWVLTPLQRRSVSLTEEFLAKRGWNFAASSP
jgi:hypothetical protein